MRTFLKEKLSRIHFRVILLLYFGLIMRASFCFAGENDENIIRTPNYTLPNYCRDALLITKSKLGFRFFISKDFDVRIVARSGVSGSMSPTILGNAVKDTVATFLEKYRSFGFLPHAYLQVIAEAQPGAVAYLRRLPNGKIGWVVEERNHPFISNVREMIGLPWIFGRSVFWGDRDVPFGEGGPKILFLPAYSDKQHSIEGKFSVAHEIAHLTERNRFHWSRIWHEARADLMAYVATGESEMKLPFKAKLEISDTSGTTMVIETDTPRSLMNPRVENVSALIPRMQAYHYNSLIVSSLLFQIGQKFGNEYILKFISWMDTQSPAALVANFELLEREHSINEIRAAILLSLRAIGNKVREWMVAEDMDAAKAEWIQSKLKEKGI